MFKRLFLIVAFLSIVFLPGNYLITNSFGASIKLQDIPTATSIAEGDKIPFTSSPGGTPVSKNITIENLLNYYDSRRYDTLALANTAAYAAGKLLVIAKNHTLTADTVLTASVMIIPGGSFTKNGFTLTINGNFQNPDKGQCFIGFTTGVTFGPGSIEYIRAEWWGAKFDGTYVNSTSAFLSAIGAIAGNIGTGGGILKMPLGKTYANIVINRGGIQLEGSGSGAFRLGTTIFPYDNTKPAIWVEDGNSDENPVYWLDGIKLSNFRVSGNNTGQLGVVLGHTVAQHVSGYGIVQGRMDDVYIVGCTVAALTIHGAQGFIFDRVYVQQNLGDGGVIDDGYAASVDVRFSGCRFWQNTGYGLKVRTSWNYLNTLLLNDHTMVEANGKEGIYIENTSASPNVLLQITIDSAFIEENCTVSGTNDIYIPVTSGPILFVRIINTFISGGKGPPIGIYANVFLALENNFLQNAFDGTYILVFHANTLGSLLWVDSGPGDYGIPKFDLSNVDDKSSPLLYKTFATATADGLTGTINETTMHTYTVLGNSLGPYSALRIRAMGYTNGTQGTKTVRIKFGGSTLHTVTMAAGDQEYWLIDLTIRRRSTPGLQSITAISQHGTTLVATPPPYLAVDTTVNKDLLLTFQLGNAGDQIYLNEMIVEKQQASSWY